MGDFQKLSDYFAAKKKEEAEAKPVVSSVEANKFAKGLLGYDPNEDEEKEKAEKN